MASDEKRDAARQDLKELMGEDRDREE